MHVSRKFYYFSQQSRFVYFLLTRLISTIQFSFKFKYSSPTSLSTPFAVPLPLPRRFAGTLSACAFQQLHNYRCATPSSETKRRSRSSWSLSMNRRGPQPL
ncbi:Hypothetical_protein [Hexamita inflata]|uniref:Hypothetical_protein n=1 Tax=Hexamita inflata TaxID=28002 RepID=A0AA86UR87_9EUKA|nr:Hypothetical protein HINF_LOCUS35253 [Hexamita inflata]